ncbi:MAG TPA: sulfite exporter TauE/SafE family protein [Rubrobacter sp.]|nr:sulfite exporter TauE/SafE family protein [Rubrobacter sp.]
METHILFFVAAVAAGLINSLAGGGGLITFPLLALVVPPVVADATSALALLPAYPSAVWRTRSKLREVRRLWLWLLLVTSALGGLVGALMLVWTGDQNFLFLVPWLVLGGTVLFVLEPRLSRRGGGAHQDRVLTTALWTLAAAVVFVVALYGGYFGAGIGILMISALSLLRMGDVHRVVPLKNLLAGCLRGVAVVVLVIYGEIHWGYGVPMAVGGLIGGYVGGALTGRVNHTVLRGVVVIIGFGLAAYYFWTLYGRSVLHITGE